MYLLYFLLLYIKPNNGSFELNTSFILTGTLLYNFYTTLTLFIMPFIIHVYTLFYLLLLLCIILHYYY